MNVYILSTNGENSVSELGSDNESSDGFYKNLSQNLTMSVQDSDLAETDTSISNTASIEALNYLK